MPSDSISTFTNTTVTGEPYLWLVEGDDFLYVGI